MERRTFLKFAPAAGLTLSAHPLLAQGLSQVAAVQRFTVGGITVTALSDGYLQLDASLLNGADEARLQQALTDAYLDPSRFLAAVNAFLVESGENTVLIDAGTGTAMGPNLGQLDTHLQTAGVAAGDITHVLCTHLHPDHVGGAVDDGAASFLNAELVVAQEDLDFWTNPDIRAGAPDEARGFFDLAVGVTQAYADRTTVFSGETSIAPGITAIPLPGHTPGHTGYMIEDGGESLMIWGDIVHVPPMQFADPSVTIAFDTDAEQAAATRAQLLDRVATDRQLIAGAHIGFPGVGYVAAAGEGYRFIPTRWQYE
ncbi:MBL fold metallo-hydrolase [Pontivivens ytuae]|uniref:MBL fold metallo-hydrolase n=1 Tax=Pontivivens ytuae TaxID=2789856 RepID=A0A7S9QCE3_9RHOB|nr:MBL fold metallo-hydrolase [Pontivivens ytuae]QPH53016.1 MBL fold metallo-hydrolase [Pontivivens ytuae]